MFPINDYLLDGLPGVLVCESTSVSYN